MWNQPYAEHSSWPPYDQYPPRPQVSEVRTPSASCSQIDYAALAAQLAALLDLPRLVAQVCGVCSFAGHPTHQCPSLANRHTHVFKTLYQGNPINYMDNSISNPYHTDLRYHQDDQWMDSNEQQCFYDGEYQATYPEFYPQEAAYESPHSASQPQQMQQPAHSLDSLAQMLQQMEARMARQEKMLDQVVRIQNQQHEQAYQLILEEEEDVEPFVPPPPQGNSTHSSIHVSTNPYAPCVPFPNSFQHTMTEVAEEAYSHQLQDDDLSNDVEFGIKEKEEDVPSSPPTHSAPLYAPPIDFMDVEHVEMVIGAHTRTDKELLLLMCGGCKTKSYRKTKKKRRPFMCYLAKHSLSPKLLSKEHVTSLMNTKRLMEHVAEFLTFEEVGQHSLAAGL